MSKNIKTDSGILIVAQNKKARHDYEILNNYEAGIVLTGSEVKSIRDGGINLRDSYIKIHNNEVFLIGCHIKPYTFARREEINETRDRKLLLHGKEILKLHNLIQQKGLTAMPIKAYFKNGRCKLDIGVGRGKKLYDKRQDVKDRDNKRELARISKITR